MKKLLIVDDDQVDRMHLVRMLKGDSFEIHEAENGSKALDVFSKCKFDLAIIDIIMPEMDGIELLVKLKKADPEIPVIMVTGKDEIDSYIHAKDLGAFEYIVKPVNQSLLEEMISSIFP